MYLQPDAVASAVAEVVAVTGSDDEIAGQSVDRFAGNTGVNAVDSRGVGLAHGVVDAPEGVVARVAQVEGARQVALVAVDLCAQVNDNDVARL